MSMARRNLLDLSARAHRGIALGRRAMHRAARSPNSHRTRLAALLLATAVTAAERHSRRTASAVAVSVAKGTACGIAAFVAEGSAHRLSQPQPPSSQPSGDPAFAAVTRSHHRSLIGAAFVGRARRRLHASADDIAKKFEAMEQRIKALEAELNKKIAPGAPGAPGTPAAPGPARPARHPPSPESRRLPERRTGSPRPSRGPHRQVRPAPPVRRRRPAARPRRTPGGKPAPPGTPDWAVTAQPATPGAPPAEGQPAVPGGDRRRRPGTAPGPRPRTKAFSASRRRR